MEIFLYLKIIQYSLFWLRAFLLAALAGTKETSFKELVGTDWKLKEKEVSQLTPKKS